MTIGETSRTGRRAAAIATRGRMLDAARALADEGGYERVTVAQVTQRAGTSRATFYLYFENIREIYLLLAERATDAVFEGAVSGWTSVDLVASLDAWVRGYVTVFREHAGVLRVGYGHRFDDADFSTLIDRSRARLARQLAINLDGAVAIGLAREVDTTLVAEALNSTLESMCVFEIDAEDRRDLDTLCSTLVDLWVHAVVVDGAPTGTT